MEIVDAIEGASVSSVTKVGNVGFGEKVGNVGLGIDDGSADDSNGTWDIGTSNVGLQERCMYLSCVDGSTRLCVESADPVLGGGEKEKLGATGAGCVYQWLCVKLVTPHSMVSQMFH